MKMILQEEILNVTREGRVQDWNERIADIALMANVRLEYINWNSSPLNVAREVVEYCGLRERLEELKRVVESKK